MSKPKSKAKPKQPKIKNINDAVFYGKSIASMVLGARFRFHTDTGISGIVKADSHDKAVIAMGCISFDPVIKKKAFAWDEADVKYPQITVAQKPC